MEPASQSFEARDFGWLVTVSFVFLALVVFALWREFHPVWRPVQARFRAVLEKYGGTERARTFTPGIKQIWVAKIRLVDRCITCHLGYEWGSILPASCRSHSRRTPIFSTWTSIRFRTLAALLVMEARDGRPARKPLTAARTGTTLCFPPGSPLVTACGKPI